MANPDLDPALETVVAEDLDYLTTLVEKEEISNGEVRRSSVILRGLVCDNNLQRVATARGHALRIRIPETRALVHDIESDDDLLFFQLGGYRAFGIDVSCSMIERRATAANRPFDPNASFEAPLKTYLRQPVMFLRAVEQVATEERPAVLIRGTVSRESLIRYVAHKVGGAHYDVVRTSKEHELLDIVRRVTSVEMRDGFPTISLNPEPLESPVARARVPLPGVGPLSRDQLDPVLLELLGAARYILESPAVRALREALGT